MTERDVSYLAFEPVFPLTRDPGLVRWRKSLEALPPSQPTLREATVDPGDARRLKDLQLACEPIMVQTVQHNATMIAEHLVLLAEIGNVHVGFCMASIGSGPRDPTFIQVVAVAPPAQRRGVAMALLDSIGGRAPQHDIAFATRDDNTAALALTTRFAERIGASLRPVPPGTYRHGDLGTARGLGYRPWLITQSRNQNSR
ncbi:GNAT family N-acetyltransferase [Curtobacterium sp. SGAir0471]|uniref:GNAT family N-acetyltransferase n=1 Tax=Curtobacterium sp. SGAir0471 TaxID=2070337 RepID=UPI0010F585B1|nr:GNAT family N-acetyltransferase [Curtobacterium sp. SGAir0471]